MKPELYLHIGCGKTGTTALQHFFWENRAQLADRGITYPEVGVVSGAHHLVSPFQPDFAAEWKFLGPSIWCPLVKDRCLDKVLMSSELIAWTENEGVNQFISQVRRYFDLNIVFYARRQDELVIAGYNQQVKMGFQTQLLVDILEEQAKRFDFSKMLDPWAKALGTDSIIVRVYDREKFPNHSVVDDFCSSILGLDKGSELSEQHPEGNPRLGLAALEFKRLLNSLFSDPHESREFLDALLAYSNTSESKERFKSHNLLNAQQRAKVFGWLEESNEAFARNFFGKGGEELFSIDLNQSCGPVETVPLSELISIAGFLKDRFPVYFRKIRQALDLSNQNKQELDTLRLTMDQLEG